MRKPTQYQTRITLVGIVTASEFYTSASHIIATATNAGNPMRVAATYPLVIDGMILAAVLTLATRKGVNKMARFYATWARVLGYAATMYCNVAASGFHSLTNSITYAFPGAGLILVLELAIHSVEQTPAARRTAVQDRRPTRLRSVS